MQSQGQFQTSEWVFDPSRVSCISVFCYSKRKCRLLSMILDGHEHAHKSVIRVVSIIRCSKHQEINLILFGLSASCSFLYSACILSCKQSAIIQKPFPTRSTGQTIKTEIRSCCYSIVVRLIIVGRIRGVLFRRLLGFT